MGVTSIEKVDLSTYELKDVAQTCYTKLRNDRSLNVRPVTWEIFTKAFIDRFILRGKRKAKVEKFINLH